MAGGTGMIIFTLCVLALDAGLMWIFSRYTAAWVRPAIMGSLICGIFIFISQAFKAEGGVVIHVPSQTNLAICMALVTAYYGGRRLFKVYQFASGKTRHPVQVFIADFLRRNRRPN